MYRILIAVMAAALLALIILQCSDKATPPPDDQTLRPLTDAEKELVASGNLFGLKLFREVVTQEPDSNIFVSPLSVAMALGMTYNGARNETQVAMQEALELQGMSLEDVNKSFRSLIDLLVDLDPKVRFQIANSIWIRENFAVEAEFINLNQTYFDALVTALDFGSPDAVPTINGWVNDNTNGKIPEIIDEIGSQIVMYLINAIYFKGDWASQFDKDDTYESPFFLNDGSQSTCQMMTQHQQFPYLEQPDFIAVDLPYGDGEYSMTVFLPKPGVALDDLITQFTAENWETWLNGLYMTELPVSMPKFELEYGLKLNSVLIALGMGVAFDELLADFTGINPAGQLYLDEVLHKTYVKVDEEGTEAAAVTAVGVGLTSAGPFFCADRPFAFVIRESHSGTLLFMGKIVKPEWDS